MSIRPTLTSSQLKEWDIEQEKIREILKECEKHNEGVMAINLKIAMANYLKKQQKLYCK